MQYGWKTGVGIWARWHLLGMALMVRWEAWPMEPPRTHDGVIG